MTQDPATGMVPRERLWTAYGVLQRKLAMTPSLRGGIEGLTWEERGPDNVAGRIRAICVDRNDPSGETVWVAGVTGGLWKCSQISAADPGWVPLDDFFPNLVVSTLVQAPTNPQIMYFGTGEGWFNSGVMRGFGIWKSTDGGTSWTHLSSTATPDFRYIQQLLVDPAGHLFAATRAQGLQRSTDGGHSWTCVLGPGQPAADIERAANGDLYASLGIFSPGSLHKSTDGGSTWTQLEGGLPTSGFARVEIACAPSDPDRVYALLQNSTSMGCLGIYRSDDGGAHWVDLGTPPAYGMTDFTRNQGWYNLIAAVAPDNPDRVFAGGIDLLVSDDAGQNWTQVTQWFGRRGYHFMHPDQHAIVFDPLNPDIAYLGNDGGIYRTVNARDSLPRLVECNKGLNITQFYACAISPEIYVHEYLAGSQDNGTQRFLQPGQNSTDEVTGGDGAFCHIDAQNPLIQISSHFYNSYNLTLNGWQGSSKHSFGNFGRPINPTVYDSQWGILYTCGHPGHLGVIKDIKVGAPFYFPFDFPQLANRRISALALSVQVPNRLWVGTDRGHLLRIDDVHTFEPRATRINAGSGMPIGYISCIAVDHWDDDHLLVTYSNYGLTSVWETQDGGDTWTAREGDLPDMPVRWAIFHPSNPRQALLATELGVWSTADLSAEPVVWAPSNTGLAHVRTDMLKMRELDNYLIAATHGRGLFSSHSFSEPKVLFIADSSLVYEDDSPLQADCRAYHDVSTSLMIGFPPNQEAQVAIEVEGTATRGSDFDLLTPTLTFPAQQTDTQQVWIRIYDDMAQDSGETIILRFQLQEGTDVTPSSLNASHTMVIHDRDVSPLRQAHLVWGESFDTVSPAWSFSAQPVPGISLVNRWVIDTIGVCDAVLGGSVARIAFDSLGTLDCDYHPRIPSIAYLSRSVPGAAFSHFSLEFDWVGQGEEDQDYGQAVYSANGGQNWVSLGPKLNQARTGRRAVLPLPRALDFQRFWVGFRWENDWSQAHKPNFTIDNVAVYATPYRAIATNLMDGGEAYLGPLAVAYFFHHGALVAALHNHSTHDFGCTRVHLDRSGSGVKPLWLLDDMESVLADKTLWVEPDFPDSLASVSITLYLTETEVQAWEQATGKTFLTDAKVIKNGGPIRRITPYQVYPDGNTLTQAIDTAIFLPENLGYAIQATFTGHLGGYGVGDPGPPPYSFPVGILGFEVQGGRHQARLIWNVSPEMGVAGYVIERSSTGLDFQPVGEVLAQQARWYTYDDQGLATGTYHYRLRADATDGQQVYSGIRTALVWGSEWAVYPNPFTDVLNLRIPEGIQGNAISLRLITPAGQEVWAAEVANQPGTHRLQMKPLAAGTYHLWVHTPSQGHQLFALEKR